MMNVSVNVINSYQVVGNGCVLWVIVIRLGIVLVRSIAEIKLSSVS